MVALKRLQTMDNFVTVTKDVYFRGGVIYNMGFLKTKIFFSVYNTIRVQCVAGRIKDRTAFTRPDKISQCTPGWTGLPLWHHRIRKPPLASAPTNKVSRRFQRPLSLKKNKQKITIQRISTWETNYVIQWIEIYPSDSAIHLGRKIKREERNLRF